jgi:OmcA/MtrC family decaheme c-type cytochrome
MEPPVKLNAYSATVGTEMLTGFGQTGPTIAIAFAVPQDGITAPADFNVRYSASLASLWNTTAATNTGTLSGPDASGNYTAVITGTKVSPDIIPANAVMVAAFLGYAAFTQDAGYNGLDTGLYPKGLVLPAQVVQKVATGYTARRQIVATANCNACHGQLGLFTGVVKAQADDAFHGGQNNDANGCAICHSPNGLHTDAGGWTINIDSWVHSIHAAAKRTVPFNPSAHL